MEDSRRFGRARDGRTWRTSTAIPAAICYVAWLPGRLLRWLVSVIMDLARTVLLTAAIIVGAFLVVSWFYTGWQQGVLGALCLVCAGVIAFSVLPPGGARR